MPSKEKIGEPRVKLLEQLKALGVSQAEIARRTGCSSAMASLYFNGKYGGASPQIAMLEETIRTALRDGGFDENEIAGLLEEPASQPKLEFRMKPETLRAFGLPANPFRATSIQSESDIFLSQEHVAAVERIKMAAQNGEFLFLVAPQGTGKSTVIDRSISDLHRAGNGYVRFAAADSHKEEKTVGAMFNSVADALKLPYRSKHQQEVLNVIGTRLSLNKGRPFTLIVDDGHTLRKGTLLAMKRRWDNLKETGGYRHLIAIIVLAQPMGDIFQPNQVELTEVRTHVEFAEMLGLISPAEVAQYIKIKMRPFGGCDRYFTAEVPNEIFRTDRDIPNQFHFPQIPPGIESRWAQIEPRRLNAIIEAAMDYAVEDGTSVDGRVMVTAATINAIRRQQRRF